MNTKIILLVSTILNIVCKNLKTADSIEKFETTIQFMEQDLRNLKKLKFKDYYNIENYCTQIRELTATRIFKNAKKIA